MGKRLYRIITAFLIMTVLVMPIRQFVFAAEESTEAAVAAEEPADSDSEIVVVNPEEVGDNDELLMEYMEISMSTSDAPKYSSFGLRNLSGIDAKVYELIKTRAAMVAGGEETSTVFTFTMRDLGLGGRYSAADLGVSAVVSNGAITEAGKAALKAKLEAIHLSRIVTALLFDCPAEFYWYEKTIGCKTDTTFGIGASYDSSIEEYVLYFSDTSQVIFSFAVSEDYAVNHASGTYVVDSSVIGTIQTALDHANAIIISHVNETDYEKLASYKEEICNAVSYNTTAGNHNYTYSYGNPWQIIWVFDDDSSTNVVCEGYSKAFQFLCDGSEFNNETVQSRIVSGTMTGGTGAGGHMWNVVTMEDGKNYLVDVTNCDGGTIESPDKLFLVGDGNGSVSGGYSIVISGKYTVSYVYDDITRETYEESEIVLAEDHYDPDNVIPVEHIWESDYRIDKEATCTEEGAKSIHCSECGIVKKSSVIAIAKKDHSYRGWKVTKEATCTATGSKESFCRLCGHKEIQTIAATGHDLTYHKAIAADYDHDGNSEYWSCSRCRKYFSDKDAKTEIAEDSWVIPNKRQKYGNHTGLVDDEGTLIYLANGKPDTSFSGILKYIGGWYYVKDGYVDTTYEGVEKNEYGWWKIVNGKVDFNFNGLAVNKNGTWYLKDGKVDFEYTGFAAGIAQGESGWWYVEDGQVKFNRTDILSGTANTDADKAGVSGWWRIVNSKVYTGDTVANNAYGWWVIRSGKVDFNFNGFASNQYGWWYIENGKVTFEKNDVIKGTANNEAGKSGEAGWWLVRGSKVVKETTIAKNSNGWWRIEDGKVNFNFTGLAKNEYGWWYLKDGKVDFGYTAFTANEYGWWYVEGGQVTFNRNDVIKGNANNETGKAGIDGWWLVRGSKVTKENTVAKNVNGWWRIEDGRVNFGFTGLAGNQYGIWYLENGKVNFNYNGIYDGNLIVDGKVYE